MSAVAICHSIQTREASATEVLDAVIDRISAVNPVLNALVVDRFERATDEARKADDRLTHAMPTGQLHGLPITVKETLSVQGLHTCAGTISLNRTSSHDATVVSRLRNEGALVIGATNVPQLLWFNETDNPIHGRTNNPWHPDRTTGGSSGGEGALIASGASPLGIGTDSGGSGRSPAHFCGIDALKPTSGRLSTQGSLDDIIFAGQEAIINQPAPMARHVCDLELLLNVLSAPGGTWLDTGVTDRAQTGARSGPLRIGYFGSCTGYPVAEQVLSTLDHAASQLEAGGCALVTIPPPDLERAMSLYDRLVGADGGKNLTQLLQGCTIDWRIEEYLDGAAAYSTSTFEYWQLLAARTTFCEDFLRVLDRCQVDALICPPDAGTAFAHGESPIYGAGQAYAALFNILGLPAGVVTLAGGGLASSADPALGPTQKLPAGVQVVGRRWQERTVLDVMYMLEDCER
jgi:fatty acid amide hydrolase